MEATRNYKMLVLSVTAGVLLLAIVYAYIWPPIYKVESMVTIEKDTDTSRDSFYGNWNVFRKQDGRTEIELMTSAPVLKQVIDKEHLKYDDIYHPFMSEISYMWEKSLPGRTYKSMRNRIWPDKDMQALTPEQIELGRTINDMAAGILIQPIGESNAAKITIKGPSRKVADINNSLLDVYQAWRTQQFQNEAQRSVDVLTDEISHTGGILKSVEDRRLKFANEHGLTFDLQKETMELRELTDLEAAVATSRQKVASLEASLAVTENSLAKEPPNTQISSLSDVNTVREAARLKRLEMESALLAARDHFREDSPEIQEIKGDMAKLDTILAREPERVEKGVTQGLNVVQQQLISSRNNLASQLAGEQHGLSVMETETATLRDRLHQVPNWQNSLHDFDREFNLAQETYNALVLKRAQAEASLATSKAAMPSMRIIGYAMPPSSKWWPRAKLLYPGAILVGLLLGICAAVIVSYASGRVRRLDLETGKRTIPLYGSVALASDHPFVVMPRSAASSSKAAGD